MSKGTLPALLALFSCILPLGLQDKCSTDNERSPYAPFLTIKTVEFPDEDVIPVGYNVTIVCNGSLSRQGYRSRYNAQPYQVAVFRGRSKKKECGGKSQDTITCTLVIQNTTITDSGVYRCWAQNRMSYTIVELNITLKEPSPPRFTVHPLHQTDIFVNHQANLSCQATGVPRPAITWFKDDHPVTSLDIRQMRNYSLLNFESVSPQDQGRYWCEATSAEGWNRSTVANLSVIWKPFIAIHPRNMSAYEGANVTLSCAASGSPRPEFHWLKNNSPIKNASIFQNGSFSTLFLLSVKPQKISGQYKCVAKSSLGEAVSMEGTLTVLKPTPAHTSSNNLALEENEAVTGPTFYRHPESVAASRDSSVVFTCAARGSPLPGITWMKDNKVLYSKTDYVESLLLIKSVKENNVGVYACLAVNSMGNTTSKEAVLSLKGNSSKVVWILIGTTVCLAVVVIILLISKTTKWKEVCNKQNDEDVQHIDLTKCAGFEERLL